MYRGVLAGWLWVKRMAMTSLLDGCGLMIST